MDLWGSQAQHGPVLIKLCKYFDLQGGIAKFAFTINGQPSAKDASWSADASLPTPHPHGDNSTAAFLK